MTEFYNYSAGPEFVASIGKMRPFGDRILLRAIMYSEAYKGALTLVEYNSSDAECFEVLAVGGSVAKWCAEHSETAPIVGQHCDIRSNASDRVAQKDPTGRYWLVSILDLASVWDPVEMTEENAAALVAFSNSKKNIQEAPAANNGEADLTPREPRYAALAP